MLILAIKVRRGNILHIDGTLYRVMEFKHSAQGNYHASVTARIRNMTTGNSSEKRWNTSDKVERAELETRQAEFLYAADGKYTFMDQENYEQVELDEEMLGDSAKFLQPNGVVQLTLHEGVPIGVELPKVVEMKVVATEPYMRSATATAMTKPATLENGVVIQVPGYLAQGETIRIDTETMEYMDRVKN
jgi:elongation factor P